MAKESKCKVEGCKGTVRAKGYCARHYDKWRRGEYGKTRYKTCKVEECHQRRFQKAYCEEHFKSKHLKQAVAPAPVPAAAAAAGEKSP